MKIAIVLPTIISKNGTVKQSLELAKNLSNRGHQIKFFTFAYSRSTTFPEFGKFSVAYCVQVENSLIHRLIKNLGYLELFFLYFGFIHRYSFRRLLKNGNFDIINPHDWFTIWVTANQKASANLVANINDVPNRIHGGIINQLKLKADRKYASNVDRFIVLDNYNNQKLRAWLQLPKNKVVVIRSGIDIEQYKKFDPKTKINLRQELKIDEKSILLVCANLLAPNRRYEDIIHALPKIENVAAPVHLAILSKLDFHPQYARFLKQLVRQKNLGARVHFIDRYFSDQERMAYIAGADLLVFPNSPQTWGLTVIEAMALGVPVIVSNGSGVSEVLTDNVNALIYPAGNVSELAHQLSQILSNREKLDDLAARGKDFALSNFSWDLFGQQIETLFQKVHSDEKNIAR